MEGGDAANLLQGILLPVLTPYHCQYFACELTKRSESDSIVKLGPSLFNAQVGLNPHQLDVALFACGTPVSRDTIVAGEVDR